MASSFLVRLCLNWRTRSTRGSYGVNFWQGATSKTDCRTFECKPKHQPADSQASPKTKPRSGAGSRLITQLFTRNFFSQLHRWLIKGIDSQHAAGENGFQHEVHQGRAESALIEPI